MQARLRGLEPTVNLRPHLSSNKTKQSKKLTDFEILFCWKATIEHLTGVIKNSKIVALVVSVLPVR